MEDSRMWSKLRFFLYGPGKKQSILEIIFSCALPSEQGHRSTYRKPMAGLGQLGPRHGKAWDEGSKT